MHLVVLNGGPGAGKSTFVRQLRTHMSFTYDLHARPESLVAILRSMLFQFGCRYGVSRMDGDDEEYVRLKRTVILGHTGREWQIAWGNGMRNVDKDVFTKDLIFRINTHMEGFGQGVFLTDDLGFPDEVALLAETYGSKNLTILYLGARINSTTEHGEQFPGDSRICLKGLAHLLDPTIEDAALYIRNRIEAPSRT